MSNGRAIALFITGVWLTGTILFVVNNRYEAVMWGLSTVAIGLLALMLWRGDI